MSEDTHPTRSKLSRRRRQLQTLYCFLLSLMMLSGGLVMAIAGVIGGPEVSRWYVFHGLAFSVGGVSFLVTGIRDLCRRPWDLEPTAGGQPLE